MKNNFKFLFFVLMTSLISSSVTHSSFAMLNKKRENNISINYVDQYRMFEEAYINGLYDLDDYSENENFDITKYVENQNAFVKNNLDTKITENNKFKKNREKLNQLELDRSDADKDTEQKHKNKNIKYFGYLKNNTEKEEDKENVLKILQFFKDEKFLKKVHRNYIKELNKYYKSFNTRHISNLMFWIKKFKLGYDFKIDLPTVKNLTIQICEYFKELAFNELIKQIDFDFVLDNIYKNYKTCNNGNREYFYELVKDSFQNKLNLKELVQHNCSPRILEFIPKNKNLAAQIRKTINSLYTLKVDLYTYFYNNSYNCYNIVSDSDDNSNDSYNYSMYSYNSLNNDNSNYDYVNDNDNSKNDNDNGNRYTDNKNIDSNYSNDNFNIYYKNKDLFKNLKQINYNNTKNSYNEVNVNNLTIDENLEGLYEKFKNLIETTLSINIIQPIFSEVLTQALKEKLDVFLFNLE